MRIKFATLASIAGLLSAIPASVITANVTPASVAPLQTVAQAAAASKLDCTSVANTPGGVTQNQAEEPLCTGSKWVYDLPAQDAPHTPRRTETWWGSNTAIQRYGEGQTVTHEAVYTGNLGAAAQADNDWHVMWQLVGQYTDGGWRHPVMTINVRNGQLRLTGGAGRLDQNWVARNYEWTRPLATWTDGKPVRVKVQTYLSSDPAKGWVSAWVDGKQVLNRWKPTSYAGNLHSGTWYPGQAWVASRNGLYRGTQAGDPPKYRQIVSIQVVRPS